MIFSHSFCNLSLILSLMSILSLISCLFSSPLSAQIREERRKRARAEAEEAAARAERQAAAELLPFRDEPAEKRARIKKQLAGAAAAPSSTTVGSSCGVCVGCGWFVVVFVVVVVLWSCWCLCSCLCCLCLHRSLVFPFLTASLPRRVQDVLSRPRSCA